MICKAKTLIRFSIATMVGGAALFWSGEVPLNPQQALMSSADARIGRPLTPLSYAGVARRTTRRRSVAAGAVYVAPVVVAPVVVVPVVVPRTCVQSADAYGRIYTRCY